MINDKQLEEPEKLEHIYIHKTKKDYVTVILTRQNTGAIFYEFLISEKGFNGVESNEGIFSEDFLPNPVASIYITAANLSKYLKKNGYKGVTTIKQTKNGVKLS